MKRMLIVNDELSTARSYGELFQNEGFKIDIAQSEKETYRMIGKNKPHIVLLDIDLIGNEEDCSGISVLKTIRKKWSENDIPVIIISRYLDSNKITKLETLHINNNYYPFPIDNMKLLRHVRSYFSNSPKKENSLPKSQATPYIKAAKCIELNKRLSKLAGAKRDIVFYGERGTGKTLFAEHYHKLMEKNEEKKRSLPWIRISCATLAEGRFEAQVFGQTKDSGHSKPGLIEAGNHGIVFFDDIDMLPKSMQLKMQELLATKTYQQLGSNRIRTLDCVFVLAMCSDSEATEIEKSLMTRIRRMATIELPPLRERLEDVQGLVQRFVEHFNSNYNRHVQTVDPEVLDILKKVDLEGNVSDLEAIIENGVISCIGDKLMIDDIKDSLPVGTSSSEASHCYRGIRLLLEKREVYIDNKKINMTTMLFDLLRLFVENSGKVFTRDEITEYLRKDSQAIVDESTTNSHIMRLRKKLGAYGNAIETIRGIGYKLIDQ